jgi:hypothetical protein
VDIGDGSGRGGTAGTEAGGGAVSDTTGVYRDGTANGCPHSGHGDSDPEDSSGIDTDFMQFGQTSFGTVLLLDGIRARLPVP